MNNQKTIEDGISKARSIIRSRVMNAIKATAFDLTELTDVPVWTHNLWDSIGCGIYENGVLVEYSIPPKEASEPRSGADEFPMEARKVEGSEKPLWSVPSGVDRDRAWWGRDELFDMLNDPPASIRNCQGFALYYVAAMPYAAYVENDDEMLNTQHVAPLFFKHIRIVK